MSKLDKAYYAIMAGLTLCASIMMTMVIVGLTNNTITANSGGIFAIVIVASTVYSHTIYSIKRYWKC